MRLRLILPDRVTYKNMLVRKIIFYGTGLLLAPAVTVGETEGAMDSTSVFFWPLLLPITL